MTGFLPEERAWVSKFIDESGFVDSFRAFHEEEPDHYTWWDPKHNARAYNRGWRLDYIFVSKEYFDNNVLGEYRNLIVTFLNPKLY
jgi:exodeoxyribonuclease-3